MDHRTACLVYGDVKNIVHLLAHFFPLLRRQVFECFEQWVDIIFAYGFPIDLHIRNAGLKIRFLQLIVDLPEHFLDVKFSHFFCSPVLILI